MKQLRRFISAFDLEGRQDDTRYIGYSALQVFYYCELYGYSPQVFLLRLRFIPFPTTGFSKCFIFV